MNKCPLCDEKNKVPIVDLCANMKIMGNNFPAEKSEIVCCAKCGLVYTSFQTISQEHFNEYYMHNSKTVKYEDVYGDISNTYFRHVFDVISKYVSKDDKIIDIASGYGEIAQCIKAEGYNRVIATEIKDECIEYIQSKNISVVKKNVYEMKNTVDKYKLAIISHDLEHFMDVRIAMENVLSVVEDNGYIFIEVPDATQYDQLDRPPYHFLTYEHVTHFTEVTIENLANKCGLTILEIGKSIKCNDYPCVYAVMQKTGVYSEIKKEEVCSYVLRNYVNKCENEIKNKLKKFVDDGTPLILWGIGASTAQLLNYNFDNCNVIQLIDTNPMKYGIEFKIGDKNIKIEGPEQIENVDATILILPFAYKKSIENSIIGRGLRNTIESI